MIEIISKLFNRGKHETVSICTSRYRDRYDVASHTLMQLVGCDVEILRNAIPFLITRDAMTVEELPKPETIAYNGEEADEIHYFTSVTQGGSRITRVLLRNGVVVELTVK